MKRFTRSYASLAITAAFLGNIQTHYASAGCGCNDCASTSCTTYDAGAATPGICGLGNGLLDYLDKASGRFETNFFRLRSNSRSCDSKCDTTCDGFESGASFSSMVDDSYESHGSNMQHQTSPSHSHSHPSQGGSSGSFNESPVPMPIPDPIASPPSSYPSTAPSQRKPGNPFNDEARSVPKAELVAPMKVTYSIRPSGSQELSVAKVDVKPVPKHLLRGRSVDKTLDRRDVDGQKDAIQSEVITAGSVLPSASSKVHFAR